jgi:glycosyltransferase involved in cell wall biosynthesis
MPTVPRVSIGMPVYNGAKWLVSTIQTVLAQSCEDMELVISDNASTDNTEEVCRSLAKGDSRVRYTRNAENIGIANNFNRVFHLARGAYFKWMSCGDLLDRVFVERCMDVLNARSEVVLVYPVTRLFTDEPAQGEDARDAFDLDVDDPVARFVRYSMEVRLNCIMHGVYRADALRKTRLYQSFIAADYNMIAELLLYGQAVQLDDVLNFRRMQPETATKFLSDAKLREAYDPKQPSRLMRQEWRRMLDCYGIVVRSPLTLSQRTRLFLFLSRHTYWMRGILWKELSHDKNRP